MYWITLKEQKAQLDSPAFHLAFKQALHPRMLDLLALSSHGRNEPFPNQLCGISCQTAEMGALEGMSHQLH